MIRKFFLTVAAVSWCVLAAQAAEPSDKEVVRKQAAALCEAFGKKDSAQAAQLLLGALLPELRKEPFHEGESELLAEKIQSRLKKAGKPGCRLSAVDFPIPAVALVKMDYGAAAKGVAVYAKLEIQGDDDQWLLRAVHPLPGPTAITDDPLNGTKWTVDKSSDALVFRSGLFVSLSSVTGREGRELPFYPALYDAVQKGDAMTWSAELRSSSPTAERWEGKVTGDSMTGVRKFYSYETNTASGTVAYQAAQVK